MHSARVYFLVFFISYFHYVMRTKSYIKKLMYSPFFWNIFMWYTSFSLLFSFIFYSYPVDGRTAELITDRIKQSPTKQWKVGKNC